MQSFHSSAQILTMRACSHLSCGSAFTIRLLVPISCVWIRFFTIRFFLNFDVELNEMRRRGDLWKRAQVVLLLLAVLVLAPFLMRSALTKHDPVAAFHQRAQSQPPPPRQVVAAAAPDVSEAALVGANRSLLLARASSLESESVAPLWLLGRPRCDNSSLCAFNRAVWSELDRVQHGRNVPCPADPKTVIGCELGWSTGLGHHLHHLGHCLTRSLMHGKPVVFVDLDWSYGRGCRKQPSDHSFECFFTRFANRCAALKGLDWERDGQAGVAGRRTLNGGGDYVSWGPSMESSYWVGPSLKSRCPTPDPPLALKVRTRNFSISF